MFAKELWHDCIWIRFVDMVVVAIRGHCWRDMVDPFDLWERIVSMVNFMMFVVGGYALGKITKMFFDMWEQK